MINSVSNPTPGMGQAFGNYFNSLGQAAHSISKLPIIGGNVLAYNRVANGDAHTVRDAQHFLRSKGYNVGVDGMFGPQTSSALKAYFHNIHPNAYNVAHGVHPGPGGNNHPPAVVVAPPTGGGKGGGKVRGGRGGGGGGNVNAPSPGTPAPAGAFDPRKIAQAQANQEYNPAINSLKQLITDVQNQDPYNQSQITGWYDQMKNLMNSQYNDQGANTASGIKGVTDAIGQDAQLFGGSNAPQVATAAENAAGYLGAVGQSQQDYLKNMLPLLDAQAAQGTANEQNAARAQLNNYQDQLTNQQQAKGAAYNTDYQQALSDQATQAQNALALQQAQAMLPYQIGSARAQLKADKANAAYAGKLNQAKLQATQAQAQHYGAMTKQELAAAQKDVAQAKASGGKGAGVLAPGSTSYDRVSGLLSKSLYAGNGKHPITNPVQAQASMFHAARAMGLIDAQGRPLVPGALKMLNGMLQEQYQRDAAWQANYRWNGSQFVPKSSKK